MNKELEDFIFDRLGDIADPEAFEILSDEQIIVRHSGLVDVSMTELLEEWNKVKQGTKFEHTKLFVPAY